MMPKKISAKYYNRHYYLSPEYNYNKISAYNDFLHGNAPPKIILEAYKHIKNVKNNFLDIGCGKGELVIYLSRKGFEIKGIDYSKEAISICKKNLQSESKRTQNLASFEVTDCTKLPISKNSLNCAFMLDVDEHLTAKQLNLTLKEINRVLRKNGSLIIHTNNRFFEKITKYILIFSFQGIKLILNPQKFINLYTD